MIIKLLHMGRFLVAERKIQIQEIKTIDPHYGYLITKGKVSRWFGTKQK